MSRRSKNFPDPRLADREGLVGWSPGITTDLLLEAYSQGIFPWSDRPARWFSPDPRSIFDLDNVHFSKRLTRLLRQNRFLVTFDQAFEQVMTGCMNHHAKGQEGCSWISSTMIAAYCRFHQEGYAHSVEVWQEDALVGGLYGVQLGAFYAGESMFYRERDASKVGFAHLVEKLGDLGVVLFDSQVLTPHTASLGAFDIPRDDYLDRLQRALRIGLPQRPWNTTH